MSKTVFKASFASECVDECIYVGNQLCELQNNLSVFARNMDVTQRAIKNIRDSIYYIEVGRSGNKFTSFASVSRTCFDLMVKNEEQIMRSINYSETDMNDYMKQLKFLTFAGGIFGRLPSAPLGDINNSDEGNSSDNNTSQNENSVLSEFLNKNPECSIYVSLLKKLGMSDEEILKLTQNGSAKDNLSEAVETTLKQRNSIFIKNSGTFGEYDCVNLTYAKMKYYSTNGKSPVYAEGYDRCEAGKDAFDCLADTTGQTDLEFTQTKYGGENCLQQIVEASKGEPITDVIISFPNSGKTGDDRYGHVVYIDAIVDGKVYYTDNWDASVLSVRSINEFLDFFGGRILDHKGEPYNRCGEPIGAIVINQNTRE